MTLFADVPFFINDEFVTECLSKKYQQNENHFFHSQKFFFAVTFSDFCMNAILKRFTTVMQLKLSVFIF